MICIVPFLTIVSFFLQGFATQRFLMAMAFGDTPILGLFGYTDPYLLLSRSIDLSMYDAPHV